MSHTDGAWTQALSVSGMQLFVGASEFKDVAGLAALASAGAGLLTFNQTAGQASTYFANLSALLRRNLTYASSSLDQSQFGTAASQPGPSTVAGTSGPLNLVAGYPPIASTSMATLGHMQNGPTPKGVQINSFEIVTDIESIDASVLTTGLTRTLFTNLVAPAVTNIVALGVNGLVATKNNAGLVRRQKVTVASPAMLTNDGSEVVLNVNITAGAVSGTVSFFGAILNLSYNFN